MIKSGDEFYPGNHPEDFMVRDYRPGDYDRVAGLWQFTGLSNPGRGDDEAVIDATLAIGGKLLIMEQAESGEICGTSWMTCDGRRIYLHHFCIHPAYQGRKLSKLLLTESLRFIKNRGLQVKLEVHRTNIRAVNLYKNAGFNYLGDYDVYIIRDLSLIKIIDEFESKTE